MEMTKIEKIKAKIILSIGDWVDTPARTIPFERMIDALINSVKEECAKEIIEGIKLTKKAQSISGDTPFDNEFVDTLIEVLEFQYFQHHKR